MTQRAVSDGAPLQADSPRQFATDSVSRLIVNARFRMPPPERDLRVRDVSRAGEPRTRSMVFYFASISPILIAPVGTE